MKFVLSILITLSILSCKKNDLTKSLGEDITICFGEKEVISDKEHQLEVEFIKLLEDSRCPEGSHCFWAGRAVVQLRMNSTEEITLGVGDVLSATNVPYVNRIEYGNYSITLLAVRYDKKRHKGREEKYDIVLRVDRK